MAVIIIIDVFLLIQAAGLTTKVILSGILAALAVHALAVHAQTGTDHIILRPILHLGGH
mgnify:CR=1 FL=1